MELHRRALLVGSASLAVARPSRSRAWVHGTPLFSAQSQQFFDRLLTPPNETLATSYTGMINTLVNAGIWSVLDVLAVYATAGSDVSLINLPQSSFQQGFNTADGNMSFIPNVGWTDGGSADNAINTFFGPSTAAGKYARNNGMFGVWQIGGASSTAIVASADGSQSVFMSPLQGGDTQWAVNGDGSLVSTPNGGDGSGFWLAQRTGANASSLYQNGSLAASSSNASGALSGADIVVGTSTASSGNSMAAFVCGEALTSGQITALYNALTAFLTAVGAI